MLNFLAIASGFIVKRCTTYIVYYHDVARQLILLLIISSRLLLFKITIWSSKCQQGINLSPTWPVHVSASICHQCGLSMSLRGLSMSLRTHDVTHLFSFHTVDIDQVWVISCGNMAAIWTQWQQMDRLRDIWNKHAQTMNQATINIHNNIIRFCRLALPSLIHIFPVMDRSIWKVMVILWIKSIAYGWLYQGHMCSHKIIVLKCSLRTDMRTTVLVKWCECSSYFTHLILVLWLKSLPSKGYWSLLITVYHSKPRPRC